MTQEALLKIFDETNGFIHVHLETTVDQVVGLASALAGKQDDLNFLAVTENTFLRDDGTFVAVPLVGHYHDERYFTETEADARFLGISAKAADSDKLDGQTWEYVHSRGQNLFTNGAALLGDNTNMSDFVFDGSEAYYSAGSFKYYSSGTRFSDEMMPVDVSKKYKMSVDAKTLGGNGRYYMMTVCFDVDDLSIQANHHMYRANTLTTLAQDLLPGATTVSLTDVSNWDNSGTAGVSTHLRSLIFWNYTNSFGYLYPPETYSRNWYSNAWDPGNINFSTNQITLRVPWAGPAIPAGTPVSNGSSGGSYKYNIMNSVYIPTEWTHYEGVMDGVDLSGTNVSTKFPPGTAKIKLGWLLNYQGSGETVWFTNLKVTEDYYSPNNKPNLAELPDDSSHRTVTDAEKSSWNAKQNAIGSNDNFTIGHININDPGVNEGIAWLGGNLWKIFESPDSLTNEAGNLQFVQNSTRRLTIGTDGKVTALGTLYEGDNRVYSAGNKPSWTDVLSKPIGGTVSEVTAGTESAERVWSPATLKGAIQALDTNTWRGIVDDLTSTSTTSSLSANQGKVLKGLIDQINTLLLSDTATLDTLQEVVDYIETNRETLDTLGISNITGLQNALDSKAPLSNPNFTGKLTSPTVVLSNAATDTVANRFAVYDSGDVSYGMMLWNSNGVSGDWSTMIYGPNQSNRRISFGKIVGASFSNHADVNEIAYFDLDDSSLNLDGNIKIGNSNTLSNEGFELNGAASIGLRATNANGYVSITPLNTGWAHIYTDRSNFIFNKPVYSIDDKFSSYDADLQLQRAGSTKLTLGSTSSLLNANIFEINGGVGPAQLIIRADSDNSNEADTASILLSQDGDIVQAQFGIDDSNHAYLQSLYGGTHVILKPASGNAYVNSNLIYHEGHKPNFSEVEGTIDDSQLPYANATEKGAIRVSVSGTTMTIYTS